MQAHWEWGNLCFIHCCVPVLRNTMAYTTVGTHSFLFLTKVDDGIYSKHFLTFHQNPLNAAKYFVRLHGDTDTSIQSHNLLQHHNLKTSVLWCSVFFMVQLTRPYMTTWKIIAVTIQTLVGKEMFLLFHTPSRRVPWGNLYKLWEAPFPLPWNRQNNSSDRNGWILKSDDLHKLLSEGEVFKKRDYLLVLLWVVAIFLRIIMFVYFWLCCIFIAAWARL